MVLKWMLTLLLWAQVLGVREQKFAVEPQDQTAVVGSRVTLSCRVINKSGLLQWTKDGFGLGNLAGFERYKIIGLEEEGDNMLEIYPVMLEDDAIFRCQVGAGVDGEPPAVSRQANLSILVPPEAPKIIQGSHLFTTENRQIEVECVSAAGKPPAQITWVDREGNILQEGIENIIEPLEGKKTYTARSILKMTARKEHDNTTLTCQAQNAADHSYRSTRLEFQVKYAPKLKISIVGNGTRLVEGQDVQLLCLTSANPPDVSYRWFINDQLVLDNSSPELFIRNISQKHHNSVIRCEVINIVGKSEESVTLDVSYGPRFRVKPYSVQADIGAPVTLSCDVDGNPLPNIVWIHEDTARQGNVLTFTWEQVVSTSSNLTLTVTPDTTGRYFCRATVPGFQDVKAEAIVYMKGPPAIVSHRTQYGIPGDSVRLECSAFSIPTPQKVVWTFHGEDVGSDLDYYVLKEQLTEGIKSILIIQDSRLEHFGVYNCTVSNSYGSDVVEITLKAQKSFPLHSMLVAVMGVVVFVITVTTLYMMCQRKPKKSEGNNMKDTKNVYLRESDRSSNISELKLEIEYSGEQESESGSENAQQGTGLPLAGPVPLDHRYSQRFSIADFINPGNAQRNTGEINGYVSIDDYRHPSSTPLPAGVSPVPAAISEIVDPRYSATYGNPYLRLSGSPQLPPPSLAPQSSLPPPPYNRIRGSNTRPQVSAGTINVNPLATNV